jgi:hypothetical protein
MKNLLFIVCLLIYACTNNKQNIKETKFSKLDSIYASEKFDSSISYNDSICLYYKSTPLLIIGQNVKQLDTTLSFRYDPNGKYGGYFGTVTDYLSLDDFFSADLSTCSLAGALYFTADSSGKIFRFSADWTINGELADTSGMEIMGFLHDKLFPCLPSDFKGKHTFELTHENFIEKFKLNQIIDSPGTINGYNHWTLAYSITLTKKNGL